MGLFAKFPSRGNGEGREGDYLGIWQIARKRPIVLVSDPKHVKTAVLRKVWDLPHSYRNIGKKKKKKKYQTITF